MKAADKACRGIFGARNSVEEEVNKVLDLSLTGSLADNGHVESLGTEPLKVVWAKLIEPPLIPS